MPAIRTSPRTSYLPRYSELVFPPFVPFAVECAAFSLRAPGNRHPQAGASIRDCPPEMRFVESDADWEYVGHARGLRDIELYRHVPGLYPEILVVGADNVIVAEHKGAMTLCSPSTILDAVVWSGAPCMVFLRSASTVRYKGVYKAPAAGAQRVVPFSALSAFEQDRLAEMTARIDVPAADARAVRDAYLTGARRVRAATLRCVRGRADVRLARDMFAPPAGGIDEAGAGVGTAAHLMRGLRITGPDALPATPRTTTTASAAPTVVSREQCRAWVRTRATPAVGARTRSTPGSGALPVPLLKVRAEPRRARAPPAAKKGKAKEVRS